MRLPWNVIRKLRQPRGHLQGFLQATARVASDPGVCGSDNLNPYIANAEFISRVNPVCLAFGNSQFACKFAGIDRAVNDCACACGNFWRVHEMIKMRMADQDMVASFDISINRQAIRTYPARVNPCHFGAGQERVNHQDGVSQFELKPGITQLAKENLHFYILIIQASSRKRRFIMALIAINFFHKCLYCTSNIFGYCV